MLQQILLSQVRLLALTPTLDAKPHLVEKDLLQHGPVDDDAGLLAARGGGRGQVEGGEPLIRHAVLEPVHPVTQDGGLLEDPIVHGLVDAPYLCVRVRLRLRLRLRLSIRVRVKVAERLRRRRLPRAFYP